MNQQYVFKCPITKYFIEYIVNTETGIANIGTIGSDFTCVKAFMALLRRSIDDLSQKNVTKVRQCVYRQEWAAFLENKTTWTIISDAHNGVYEIECNIDDFLHNYGVGIGILQ